MTDSILITAATPDEMREITVLTEKITSSMVGRRELFSGVLHGQTVSLLTTGPGLINTVQAITAVIETACPDLIIHTGCAGVFKETGLQIGDIAVATREIDIRLGVESENGSVPVQPLPFPILKKDGVEIKNNYPINQKLADNTFTILTRLFANTVVNIARGPFITVSTITATDRRAAAIFNHYHPCMEAMEGAGAAYLACFYDIPLIEVRAACNFVSERDKRQWNLPLAFQRSAAAVKECIRCLKTITGWQPLKKRQQGQMPTDCCKKC